MTFTIKTKSSLNQKLLEKTKSARKANADMVAVKAAAAEKLTNDLAPDLKIIWYDPSELKASKRRVRKANAVQVKRATASIKVFGLVSPITIRGGVIVDGYSRLAAARELGIEKIPCIDISHLSESQARMLSISLNRLAECGEWDLPELKLELQELDTAGLDLSLSFFSNQELDIMLSDGPECDTDEVADDLEASASAVTELGDLWHLGKGHRVLCGDALDPVSYKHLTNGTVAHAMLTDAPYNVKIDGNVSGKGSTKHGEFKMASGEMSPEEFLEFLQTVHQHCADNLTAGAVVYSFMDWRSIDLLMIAARNAGLQHLNTAVWYKGTGGMGSFLRSAHELCGIFCKGDKPKVNNVELGKHGRDRTNVWVYPGANQPGSSSGKALKDHPTPKNLDMCKEALLDVTLRGETVLDPFLGSGTTLLAAERTRRLCWGIELDPVFVDVCIRRWQELTGQEAVLAATGRSFSQVAAERSAHKFMENASDGGQG